MDKSITYTLYKPAISHGGRETVIARGLTAVDAMARILDQAPGRGGTVSIDTYASFRRFDWRLFVLEDVGTLGLTLHATVPITHDQEGDKRVALDLIAQQFFRGSGHLWDGAVESDSDYDERCLANAQAEGRRISEGITRSVLHKLVAHDFTIHRRDDTGVVQVDVDEDVDPTQEDRIREVLSADQVEFVVRRGGQSYGLSMRGSHKGWNPIQSRHPELARFVDPIVERLRPSGMHFSDDGYEMLVIKSPNDAVGIFERLERIFGD